jgi:hypothetical protein
MAKKAKKAMKAMKAVKVRKISPSVKAVILQIRKGVLPRNASFSSWVCPHCGVLKKTGIPVGRYNLANEIVTKGIPFQVF